MGEKIWEPSESTTDVRWAMYDGDKAIRRYHKTIYTLNAAIRRSEYEKHEATAIFEENIEGTSEQAGQTGLSEQKEFWGGHLAMHLLDFGGWSYRGKRGV